MPINRYYLLAKLQNTNFTFTQILTETNTLSWLPEKTEIENYALRLPSGIPAGLYDFSIALLADTLPGSRKIELGLTDSIKDGSGFYRLARVEVSASASVRAPYRTPKSHPGKQSGATYLLNGKQLPKDHTTTEHLLKVRKKKAVVEGRF